MGSFGSRHAMGDFICNSPPKFRGPTFITYLRTNKSSDIAKGGLYLTGLRFALVANTYRGYLLQGNGNRN